MAKPEGFGLKLNTEPLRNDNPLESRIEAVVCAYARKLGWLCFKWQAVNSHRSVPDRLFFRAGTLVPIEFKRKGKNLTPAQAEIARKLAEEGFTVRKIDSIEGGKKLFDQLELLI